MTSPTTRPARHGCPAPVTPAALMRWSGLAALIAGTIFAGIQPVHPADSVSSVGTTAWAVITPLKTVMCALLLVGLSGVYARQVRRSGLAGLLGYALFAVGWAITAADVFAETVLLPPLAARDPAFVDSLLGIAAGKPSPLNLGLLPALFTASGLLYMLGGLLFGIATVRAGVFPRWASALMAATAALTPLAALLPHAVQRLAAVPMGVALIGLGAALWTGRLRDR